MYSSLYACAQGHLCLFACVRALIAYPVVQICLRYLGYAGDKKGAATVTAFMGIRKQESANFCDSKRLCSQNHGGVCPCVLPLPGKIKLADSVEHEQIYVQLRLERSQ